MEISELTKIFSFIAIVFGLVIGVTTYIKKTIVDTIKPLYEKFDGLATKDFVDNKYTLLKNEIDSFVKVQREKERNNEYLYKEREKYLEHLYKESVIENRTSKSRNTATTTNIIDMFNSIAPEGNKISIKEFFDEIEEQVLEQVKKETD